MTQPAKRKAKSSSAAKKSAKAKASWGETMKQALKEKQRSTGKGPQQPKPRDSGTFRVKKDSF